MRALVWFRSDLRVDDHPALLQACQDSDEGVVAAFLVSTEQWREHDWGTRKIALVSANLESLGRELARLGIPLLAVDAPRFADAGRTLLEILRQHHCEAVYFNREYEFNERSRDQEVSAVLRRQGFRVREFDDQTVLAPGSLKTGQGDFYSVFTPFWKSWRRSLESEALSPAARPDPIAEPISPRLQLPESLQVGDSQASEQTPSWIVGEASASGQLRSFLEEAAAEYQEQRDHPWVAATSRLSAALSLGILSPRVCLERAVSANGGRLSGGCEGIEAWIRQLAWRDFYRHVVVGFPRVSRSKSFLAWADGVEWRRDEDHLSAWREGLTGVPFVDAGMRQLRATGWLHNRLRMVTAGYLSKDLLLDWRQGEAHFMRQLVDGDFANNNGGWQWSASTGVDAAPYFRIMNPWTQARRYDPEGAYIKTWVPELSDVAPAILHDPQRLASQIEDGLDYPEPLVDHRVARIRALATFEKAKRAAA